MKKEQEKEQAHEPEMTGFVLYMDDGHVITVRFPEDELESVRDELESAMQSGGTWYVGDYDATFNGNAIENINARRIVAYN